MCVKFVRGEGGGGGKGSRGQQTSEHIPLNRVMTILSFNLNELNRTDFYWIYDNVITSPQQFETTNCNLFRFSTYFSKHLRTNCFIQVNIQIISHNMNDNIVYLRTILFPDKNECWNITMGPNSHPMSYHTNDLHLFMRLFETTICLNTSHFQFFTP